MRDIAVVIIIAFCIWAAMKHAWWGVLSLAVFSYFNPHEWAWGFGRELPAYQLLFFAVVYSTIQTKDKQPLPKDWRIVAFVLLWLMFWITTIYARMPYEAWETFWFVTKIYIPFYFTLVLINTREKLYYLCVAIALSFAVVATKGGLFAVTRGFAYRVYGPPGTQFYENNAFAVATLMCIPLMILWYRETSNRWAKILIAVSVPLCVSSALSSWSRGGLLSLGVLSLVLAWHSKRKYLILPIMVLVGFIVIQYLPEQWFERMGTIQTYQSDSSAMGRIRAWTDGWAHTLRRPLVGAGFEGWRWVTMRDWHNSFIEMLSEHGFIAFGLWLSLIVGTLISLTLLPMKTRGIPEMKWVSNYCYMIRASLLVYVAGTMFLGLSYWDILYHLIFISVLIKQFALKELSEHRGKIPIKEKKLGKDTFPERIVRPSQSGVTQRCSIPRSI